MDGEAAGARGEAADGADEVSRHEFTILPGGGKRKPSPPLLLCTACNSAVVASVAKGREAASRAVERPPGPDRGITIMLWPASGGSALAQHTPQSA